MAFTKVTNLITFFITFESFCYIVGCKIKSKEYLIHKYNYYQSHHLLAVHYNPKRNKLCMDTIATYPIAL